MAHTINHQEVIDHFIQILSPDPQTRVFRLMGEAKLGKTHFMTKVFPLLAERQGFQCAVLDLRSLSSPPDILHLLCGLLAQVSDFPTFTEQYRTWLDRASANIDVSGLLAIFSQISMRSQSEEDASRKVIPFLTTQFITDLRVSGDSQVVLLLDSVEQCEPPLRTWLMDTFLVQLAPLEHIRVVVAGRTLPDAAGSYARHCLHYQLTPVDDEAAYRDYCQALGLLEKVEQSVQILMQCSQCKPGMFADLVNNLQGPNYV